MQFSKNRVKELLKNKKLFFKNKKTFLTKEKRIMISVVLSDKYNKKNNQIDSDIQFYKMHENYYYHFRAKK